MADQEPAKKPVERETPSKPASSDKSTDVPQGANKEVWAQAEQAVVNQTGGMSGVGPEGRKAQIQKQYDQMVENDRKTKEWAGDSNLLGDQ